MSWDDGKHAKVKRVQLTYGDVINSIEVEYDGTSLRSQRRGTIGDKSDAFTLGSDEYITDVTGYYKTTFAGDFITSLTFKTNKNTYGPYGVKTRNYFSVNAPKDNQIAGFHGTSGNALNSIDVHFSPIHPSGSTGSDTGGIGANTAGTGTNTGAGGTGINTAGSGTNTAGTGTNIGGGSGTTGGGGSGPTGGGGSGTTGGDGSNTGTNTGGAGTNSGGSGPTGGAGNNTGGTGTTGGGGSNTGGTGSNTAGAGSNTGGSGANTGSGPQKLEAQGGKGGNQWDDGSDHDGVTKISVTVGRNGISFIKFDYVKNGQPKEGAVHGVKSGAMISTIDITYPDEYLVSVEGWYDSSNIIQGIKIKTNKKTSDIIGFESYGDGTPFTLEVPDKKIIGFHGFSDSNLNSLGAYFIPISASSSSSSSLTPPNKVEAQGGNNGETWDDGAFDHVKKVYVGQGDSGVAYIKFEYEKDGKIVTREHGKKTLLGTEVFEVDPGDYITSVEVSSEKIFGHDGEIVTALVFKTFKGKTSPPYGMVSGNKSELKDSKGGKLVGFHGKAGDVIYALGAYFASTPTSTTPLTPGKKLEAKGGDGGSSWDDGVFDGVRKVYVGQSQDGVSFVMFEYDKGSNVVIGNGHGKKTLLGTETFEVDYPSEYIIAVEGYYDNITGVEAPLVTSLTFKTNKKTSQPFGLTGGEKFEIKEEGYKIVGFHGKAGDVIHQIGVHVVPITG